jgi:manganese/zinc/iron transport system permease protein
MFTEFSNLISGWIPLDTWIVITGALAGMACALPGAWLLLRRQSLLGDALSHSILPGIVLSYLALNSLEKTGWLSPDSGFRHLVIFLGAAVSGVFSAMLTELIQRWGRLDSGAAIGVVFTSMFALGLLLIRMFADKTHVDPDCVLYGSLERSVTIVAAGTIAIPQSAIVNGTMLVINGILVFCCFRQLRLSTFDPAFAEAVGLNARGIQLALMVLTAATLVSAFESVGAILVIAMLIIPPATARLLTDRLATMMILSLMVAALSALLGHIAALTLPAIIFSRLGYPEVQGASTTGMMAVASGCLFVIAILGSPRYGVIHNALDRIRLRIRIAGEDILGALYRRDESLPAGFAFENQAISDGLSPHTWIARLALKRLFKNGLIVAESSSVRLSGKGRDLAQNLVRSHRLWEAYMARHFVPPGDHLHAAAEQVEHFLSPELQSELATELDQPEIDPHGKSIPGTP